MMGILLKLVDIVFKADNVKMLNLLVNRGMVGHDGHGEHDGHVKHVGHCEQGGHGRHGELDLVYTVQAPQVL